MKEIGIVEVIVFVAGIFWLEWDLEKVKEFEVRVVVEKNGLKISKEGKDKYEY